jgi:hypothetical protein
VPQPRQLPPAWQGPGGQHDRLGLEVRHILRVQRRVEPQLHLEPLQLGLVPVQQVEDLTAPGLQAREPRLAAHLGRRLRQGYPMTALGRHPGGLQARQAAAHHQNPPGPLGRCKTVAAPLELAPGRGVDHAGYPVVAGPPAPAHLVARDARPHLVGPARARLVGHVGIGDLAAHDADHVGLARADHGVRVLRRADVAFGLDPGVADYGLQPLGEAGAQLVLEQERRD